MPYPRGGQFLNGASQEERVLYAAGVPRRYWNVSESDVRLSDFATDNATFYASRQREYLTELLKPENMARPRVIGIGSTPTDDAAMAIAALLMKTAIEHSVQAMMVNLARPLDTDYGPDLLVLHNVTLDSPAHRIAACRDWLTSYTEALRVVVVAGVNPVEFFDTKLRLDFDVPLYVSKSSFIKRRSV